MWWCYLHLWSYFLKGRVRARSDVRFQSWAKLTLGWRESLQLEKLSHDCEGCLQTVHKLPVNTQEIWKISQPTPFLCFPREDHYGRRADCAEPCCRVGNFLHCDQVFSFGSGELGDWNFSLKRSVHCSQKVCHLKWYHGTLSYFCKARVQKSQSRGLVVNEVSS